MIALQGVSYSYGKRVALDGISLTFEGPGILGLLGPNGGGKSTLLQIIATLRQPSDGTVQVCGERDLAKIRRCIGVVFQNRSLDPVLTVTENLRHACDLFGLDRPQREKRIAYVLERLRLTDRKNERCKTLSGGLARRVELGKALLHEPRVLLLDEPSNGLDPEARRDLWRELTSLDITTIVATHLIEEAERCTKLAFISHGKLTAYDTPDALRARLGEQTVTVEVRKPTLEDVFVAVTGDRLTV